MGDPQLVSNSLAPFLSLASSTSLVRSSATRTLVPLGYMPRCHEMLDPYPSLPAFSESPKPLQVHWGRRRRHPPPTRWRWGATPPCMPPPLEALPPGQRPRRRPRQSPRRSPRRSSAPEPLAWEPVPPVRLLLPKRRPQVLGLRLRRPARLPAGTVPSACTVQPQFSLSPLCFPHGDSSIPEPVQEPIPT